MDWDKPELHLYAIGDTHIGSAAADEGLMGRMAEIIVQDDLARVIGMGDYIEAISYTDRRFDPEEVAQPIYPEHLGNPFYMQALRFVKVFEKTQGKWLGLISGNHETKARDRFHFDALAVIAERLGAPHVGGSRQSGWFVIRMRDEKGKVRNTVRIFVIHGWGGGELRGSDALKLQRLLWKKNADVVLLAHVHRAMTFPESVETTAGKKVVNQRRVGVICQPLIGKHGYLAKRGGNAPAPGYVVVSIRRRPNRDAEIGVRIEPL